MLIDADMAACGVIPGIAFVCTNWRKEKPWVVWATYIEENASTKE
jgi:hypothetical protein